MTCKRYGGLVVLSLVAVLVVPPAEAWGGATVIGRCATLGGPIASTASLNRATKSTESTINRATDRTTRSIDSTGRKIVEAIATAADAIKNEATAVAGEVADNQKELNVGMSNAENVTRARQNYEVLPTGVCDTLASSSVGPVARESAARSSQRVQAEVTRRAMTTRAPGSALYEGINQHRTLYCSEESIQQGRCERLSPMPNADIEPRSITNGAGDVGTVSYTFTEEQVVAGKDYLNNVVTPVTRPQLSKTEEKTESGQAYSAMRLSELARQNLAASPFVDALGWRSPVMGVDMGVHIRNIWSKMDGVTIPANLYKELEQQPEASYYFFQQTEIDRRVHNPSWYQGLVAAPKATVLREQAYMQALALSLQFEQLKMTERTNLLLGGVLAELIRQPHNDQRINAHYRQATDGGRGDR